MHELPAPVCTLEFPVIVKPAAQDASVGVDQESVCTDQLQVAQRVQYLHAAFGPPVLIEEYISGRELNVSLMELPKLEAPSAARSCVFPQKARAWAILTYGGKWKVGTPEYDQTVMRRQPELSATVHELQRIAKEAYRLLGCRDYARVDFRMKPNGKAYILEINPNPEISEAAAFTGCLGAVHMPHSEFIVRLVQQAAYNCAVRSRRCSRAVSLDMIRLGGVLLRGIRSQSCGVITRACADHPIGIVCHDIRQGGRDGSHPMAVR